MGYFQVRYDSRVVNYDRRDFIRLATDAEIKSCPNFPKVAEKVDIVVFARKLVWFFKLVQ